MPPKQELINSLQGKKKDGNRRVRDDIIIHPLIEKLIELLVTQAIAENHEQEERGSIS